MDVRKSHAFPKLADTPEVFDVVVMANLYGDILSDVASQIAGSVGLAGSANIGEHCAMFEAIHGSAPRRAGQNLANPSGLLLAAVLMLQHIGQNEVAARIQNSWLKTLEDGIHTYDIFKEDVSKEKVGTKEFGQAIVDRLGQLPQTFKPVKLSTPPKLHKKVAKAKEVLKKEITGIDIFIDWDGDVDQLHHKLAGIHDPKFKLEMIGNRGVWVWPEKASETLCIDSWRCRYQAINGTATHDDVIGLLQRFSKSQIDFTHTEHLCRFKS